MRWNAEHLGEAYPRRADAAALSASVHGGHGPDKRGQPGQTTLNGQPAVVECALSPARSVVG